MIRVRACTIRCRCHSSCRRSRFSPFGTQICGKSSFSINFRISSASWRSVFCLRTRFARIFAASPIHNSNFSSESSRSNQRACPLASHPDPHARSLRPKIAIKLFRFLGMLQPPFLHFPSLGIYKRNLLKARVIICSYNDHCSAPFSEPLWLVGPTKVYSDLGADIVMESISRFDRWSLSVTAILQQLSLRSGVGIFEQPAVD